MSRPWGKIRPAPKDHRVYTEPLIVFTLGSPGSGRFWRTAAGGESDPEPNERDSAEPDEAADSSPGETTEPEIGVQPSESVSRPWGKIVPLPDDHRILNEPFTVFTLGSPGSGPFSGTAADGQSDPEPDESDSAEPHEAADSSPGEPTDAEAVVEPGETMGSAANHRRWFR